MVQGMGGLEAEDLLKKEAFDTAGQHLGTIEAVALGRGGIPRRVGVRVKGRSPMRFLSLEEAQVDGKRVVLLSRGANDPPLRVVSGGSG
jgi:hypothetical protein